MRLKAWKWVSLVIAIGTAIILTLVLTAPADWLVSETVGVDKYEFHRPFFGEKTIQQEITVESNTLTRLDILVVDLTGHSSQTPITLTLQRPDQSENIRTVTVSGTGVRDDYYLPFSFEPLSDTAGKKFAINLAAPEATRQAPYAVRVSEDKQTFALRTYRLTTQAYVLREWSKANRQPLAIAATTIIATAALSLLLPHAATSRRARYLLLALILSLGLYFQIQIIRQLNGDPGGDGYYYYGSANQINRGVNPLAHKSYRVPFYSALLVPGTSPVIPDFLWARALGLAATVGLAGALIAAAGVLGFRSSVGFAALLWLYFNGHFLVTSVRPRPYHIFGFFLLISTVLLFKVRTTKHAFWWGILLGLTCMTRQEAFLPTAILGLTFLISLIHQRLPRKIIVGRLLAAAIPLFLVIAPYFYYNYQHYGNPVHNPYAGRSDIQTPGSLAEFWHDNLVSTRDVVTSAWLPPSQTSIKAGSQPWLLSAVAALLVFLWLGRRWIHHQSWVLDATACVFALLVLTTFLQWLFPSGPTWAQQINLLVVAGALVGVLEILRVGRWRGVVFLAVLATQLGIASFFQPAPKHFQQAYPFLALLIAAALLPLTGLPTTKNDSPSALPWWRQSLRALPLLLVLALLGAVSHRDAGVAIDTINYPAAPYYVTTTAAERLEKFPAGKVAAEVDYSIGDGIYRLHSYQQSAFVHFEEDVPPAAQLQRLCQENIRYLVDHDDLTHLTVHQDPAFQTDFRFLFDVKTVGLSDRRYRVSAYEFIHPESCTPFKK